MRSVCGWSAAHSFIFLYASISAGVSTQHVTTTEKTIIGSTADQLKHTHSQRSYLQRSEVVKGFLPPAVVAHGRQHGLGGQACGGQDLHGLGCGPVKKIPCCPNRGGHRGSAGLVTREVTGQTNMRWWRHGSNFRKDILTADACFCSHCMLAQRQNSASRMNDLHWIHCGTACIATEWDVRHASHAMLNINTGPKKVCCRLHCFE